MDSARRARHRPSCDRRTNFPRTLAPPSIAPRPMARMPASFPPQAQTAGPPRATANVVRAPSRVRPAWRPTRESRAQTRRSVQAGSFSRSRSRAGAVRGRKRGAIARPTGGRPATVAPTPNRPTVRRARSPTGRGASTRASARRHAMPGRRLLLPRTVGPERASAAPPRARWDPLTASRGSGPRRRSPLADKRTRSGGVTRELALPVGAGERDHRFGVEGAPRRRGVGHRARRKRHRVVTGTSWCSSLWIVDRAKGRPVRRSRRAREIACTRAVTWALPFGRAA